MRFRPSLRSFFASLLFLSVPAAVHAQAPTATLTVLHSFDNTGSNATQPTGPVTLDASGNVYGVTYSGGPSNQGQAFQIAPDGTYTDVHDFTASSTDGGGSEGGIIDGGDGYFYGVSDVGGTANIGAAYKFNTSGAFVLLHSFSLGDLPHPVGQLYKGSDGYFYGVAAGGGFIRPGVYRMKPDGTSFSIVYGFGSSDGNPLGGVVEGSDGYFYGTTENGGVNSAGSVYKVKSGSPAVFPLASFNTSMGYFPMSALVDGGDGFFYGPGYYGGTNGGGTIFKVSPDGTTLVDFYLFDGNGGGANPASALIRASDGNFYGTTVNGSVIFQLTPAGVKTTLVSINGGVDGNNPSGPLIEDPAHPLTFYGVNKLSGASGYGTVYKMVVTPAPPAPVISSPLTASATKGVPFSYQINATNAPTSFGATPLPAGLSVNATGLISGTPTLVGSTNVTISATNGGGTGSATLALTISALAPPVITSVSSASGQVGQAFSFQITTTSAPTGYSATGLPAGLSIDMASGLISGTPMMPGMFMVALKAANAAGMGADNLKLNILPAAPVITSAGTASGQVGVPFSFTVSATDAPTGFAATGLPPGLNIDPSSGIITGTPTVSGNYAGSLGASNDGGTGNGTLTITIAPVGVAAPVITSAASATATTGVAFSYQITATNTATSFGAAGLPAGLTVDVLGGLISGTPRAAGTFAVMLRAKNVGGTGMATLALTVNSPSSNAPPTVVITSPPNGVTLVAGASLPLSAAVTDPDGLLARVQFLVNDLPVGSTGAGGPFVVQETVPDAPGTYTLAAVAIDTQGRQSRSSITVTIVAADSTHLAVAADLLTPIDGRTLRAGTTVTLTAALSVGSADVNRVSFYADGTLVASLDANGNPITSADTGGVTRRDAATPVAAGSVFQTPYTMPATDKVVNMLTVAFDKLGRSTLSSVATFKASATSNQSPLVALSGVNNGAHVTVGSTTTVTVAASDPDKTVSAHLPGGRPVRQDAGIAGLSKLENFINKALVSTLTSPPFGFSFSPPSAGNYVLHSVATDGGGLATISDPVVVAADATAPTVTIAAAGNGMAVEGGENRKAKVVRTGDTSLPLTVRFKAKGAAKPGVDYKALSGTVTIPAGASSTKIKVKPINNATVDGTRAVKIKLLPAVDSTYVVGGSGQTKIKIFDND